MSKSHEQFQEECKTPVDIDACRKALQKLINREHTMHVPPQTDDEDILIMRALDELERLRGDKEHCQQCGFPLNESGACTNDGSVDEYACTYGMERDLIGVEGDAARQDP